MHPALAWVSARALRGAFALIHALGPDRAAACGAFIARSIGPLMKQQRIGLANLRAAFPEKTEAERRAILAQAWDNLGRVASEYVHLRDMFDYDPAHPNTGRILVAPEMAERALALRGPALLFTAHIANWELPALVPARMGLASSMLYRTPNNPVVAEEILRLRRGMMGTLVAANIAAPRALSQALYAGELVGMVVDQHFSRGPLIEFLGRPAYANPLLAQLARRHECPVFPARAVRLPGGRFRMELEPAMELPRDAKGKIDVPAATQAINDVIARWVREDPGQWLWMHRRWRA